MSDEAKTLWWRWDTSDPDEPERGMLAKALDLPDGQVWRFRHRADDIPDGAFVDDDILRAARRLNAPIVDFTGPLLVIVGQADGVDETILAYFDRGRLHIVEGAPDEPGERPAGHRYVEPSEAWKAAGEP